MLNKLSIAEWLRAHGKFVRPELTKKQRLELKECFELIDADGSGLASPSLTTCLPVVTYALFVHNLLN